MSTAVKVRPRKQTVRPRAKLWLEAGGESVLCCGLSAMLKAVEETGSLKHAAARVGRSYRFVWARIKEAEASIGRTLVETRVGGNGTHRSQLTPLAQNLLADFEDLRREVYRLVDRDFRKRVAATFKRHAR